MRKDVNTIIEVLENLEYYPKDTAIEVLAEKLKALEMLSELIFEDTCFHAWEVETAFLRSVEAKINQIHNKSKMLLKSSTERFNRCSKEQTQI